MAVSTTGPFPKPDEFNSHIICVYRYSVVVTSLIFAFADGVIEQSNNEWESNNVLTDKYEFKTC